jgi:hypothetical protein
MNLRHLTARTAIAGVTTALAAGALVGIAAPAANAAEVSNVYTCTVLGSPMDATLTVAGTLPVPQFPAGAQVPAGLVSLTAKVDPTTAGTLGSVGATQLRIDDFALSLGKGKVAIPLAGAVSGTTWDGKGKNKAFVTPDAGVNVGAVMPKAVTVTAVLSTGDVSLPCTLKTGTTPATVASITLTKQAATLKAPKSVKGKVGKATKFKVGVAGPNGVVASGKVVAKEGKKTVGSGKIKHGKAVVTLKKLKAGKHKIKLSFAGNGSFKAAKGKTTLVVKKKK